MCCNTIADVVIYVTLHNYSTIFVYSSYCALNLNGLFTTCYNFVPLTIAVSPPNPAEPPSPGYHHFTVFYRFNI